MAVAERPRSVPAFRTDPVAQERRHSRSVEPHAVVRHRQHLLRVAGQGAFDPVDNRARAPRRPLLQRRPLERRAVALDPRNVLQRAGAPPEPHPSARFVRLDQRGVQRVLDEFPNDRLRTQIGERRNPRRRESSPVGARPEPEIRKVRTGPPALAASCRAAASPPRLTPSSADPWLAVRRRQQHRHLGLLAVARIDAPILAEPFQRARGQVRQQDLRRRAPRPPDAAL